MGGKDAGEVKLLGSWSSPFVMRAQIALNIKSVQYEFIQESLQPKSELLLKSNPVHNKIPVLFHNDKPICESLVIVQYIDEVWSSSGPSILPSDSFDRATERFWAAYVDDKWFPNLYGAVLAPEEEAKAAALEQLKEGLALLEDAFSTCSKGKAFFGGDKIGHIRAVVATLGGQHGAAGREEKWRHLYSGFTVWLSESEATDKDSAEEEARKQVYDGSEAYSKADVVVKFGSWDAAYAKTVAQASLSALKQLILSDKKLPGKKGLYIRLGCRGDWPNIKPPGWDPSSGANGPPGAF